MTADALPPLQVTAAECQDFDRSARLEWVEANGTGGYAMGTVAGVNTRGYHSLLVGSLRPPVCRYVFLSRVEDDVVSGNSRIPLATVQYPGNLALRGYEHLAGFALAPFPTWRYEWTNGWLEKRLFLLPGEQTTVIEYTAGQDCLLRLRPFLAFREYHGLAHQNDHWKQDLERGESWLGLRPYEQLPALYLHTGAGQFAEDGLWYYRQEYLEEARRGLPSLEDLFTPGMWSLPVGPKQPTYLVATLETDRRYSVDCVVALRQQEERRRVPAGTDPYVSRLHRAAEQFVARRSDGKVTIIAGYPWFADWGRDSMISLPGLFIARGLLADTRNLIEGFLQYLHQGLIPNRFPDTGDTPEYNTVDATLWMFYAVHCYLSAGGDSDFLRNVFYPVAKEILHWHEVGTLHGIGVDPQDGLLAATDRSVQLTWMDAKVDDWVVTPRAGKPVEIQALWYNALRLTAHWAEQFAEANYARHCHSMADRLLHSFREKFWNDGRNCLYDVICPDGPDTRMRPNQIFAVSFPFPLLETLQQQAVVQAVERDLLTPVGLRSLAPYEKEYRPRYEGDRVQRDSAYHQGTVWPWLIGPYVSAYLRAFGRDREQLAYCRTLLTGLQSQLEIGCLGSISEIFDADVPHTPRGCPAQAWSVAELLRVLTFDLATSEDRNPVLQAGAVKLS